MSGVLMEAVGGPQALVAVGASGAEVLRWPAAPSVLVRQRWSCCWSECRSQPWGQQGRWQWPLRAQEPGGGPRSEEGLPASLR